MSREYTSNKKWSMKQLKNVIVTLQLGICLEKIQVIEKESKRQLNNMIIGWEKLKKKLDIKEQKKQWNNVILSWEKLEKKLKLKELK